MRHPIYLLLCVLIVTCSNQRNEHVNIDDFDLLAKQYFLKNVNTDSIQWLDNTEKCVLKEVIKNELSSPTTHKADLLIGDSIFVRKFFVEFRFIEFAFVRTGKTDFAFIMLPHLHDMLVNSKHYYDAREGLLFPKDSFKLNKIDTYWVDQFENRLAGQAMHSNGASSQILKFLLAGLLDHQIAGDAFAGKLNEANIDAATQLRATRIVSAPDSSTKIVYMEGIGFLLLQQFPAAGDRQNIFFIPVNGRRYLTNLDLEDNYINCR